MEMPFKRIGQALAQTIRVIRGSILALAGVSMVCSTFAATGSSPEFKLDLRGLGPWQRRTAAASEALTYSSAWATNAASGAKAVVKVMPVLKTKPKYLVIDLSGGTNATSYGISYLDEVPGGSWSDEYKTSKLVLRHIPAGSFIMGGRATDYPGAVNTNLHMVTITRDFYMGVFEVTQRQWELVMGTRPSFFTNEEYYATRPVEMVSLEDIRGTCDGIKWPSGIKVDDASFLAVLRNKTSVNGFDIPTQAQWEYACRARTDTALNNGRNLSDEGWSTCAEADEVAHYYIEYKWDIKWRNAGIEDATATVGMHMKNHFDLFDMHGNVWEWCLDKWSYILMEAINPVGPVEPNDIGHRVIRGGSYNEGARCLVSFYSHYSQEAPIVSEIRQSNIGFRLCLQGGDLPDLALASTLVNESGTGSQSWTPTRSGAYYLTHSTMNGTTNVQLASAWFEVPGCTLTPEAQGELTNGVMIAINGADEGWTVYYTTDGSVPTTNATAYAGAFSLPESGTVRAIAYNAQGIASEDVTTTFTLHDALSVVGAVARQRYPWNGMVDVDLELKGDPEKKYQVEVEAKDLDGGTNLPVKTVYVDAMVPIASNKDGSSSSDAIETIASTGAIALSPGTHRLTWNVDADIAADGEFPRVAVTVKATRQSTVAAYARSLAISTDGYAGSETLTNVPVLVRLSTNITGFVYSDFASPTNGADLAFFDANENELPYEIDEWHTNGESLVWVKLPTIAKGTSFTCAYGNSSKLSTFNLQLSTSRQHEVWREYAGVWHMNEDSGTAYDSTWHGLDALPSCGTNELADISQMVAYENGACGRARVNSCSALVAGTYLTIPSYDGLGLGGNFVASIWWRMEGTNRYPRLLSRKAFWRDESGWEMFMKTDSCTNGGMRGGSDFVATDDSYVWEWTGPGDGEVSWTDFPAEKHWVWITCLYKGGTGSVFTNGVLCAIGEIIPATDNGLPLSVGAYSGGFSKDGNMRSHYGQYDEIRLRGGSLSAARIKTDYDMIANRKFCTYGAVKKVGASK